MLSVGPILKSPTGWYWHVHHEILAERSYDIVERVVYIMGCKEPDEIEPRLRLLRPVRGPLPAMLVEASARYDKALSEWHEANARWHEACEVWLESDLNWSHPGSPDRVDDWTEALKAKNAAEDALSEANDAVRAAYATCLPELEALHAKECPDCPWDGRTIFPERERTARF